ncbi:MULTISPECIES: SDR family NAD(P)-dependent oxidoreductase [unclassified Sphingobium]|uniref:SDR family NAD(P)-dependent oxidoreductase n=1 Tax=unclassified Sphingobium TaxID=2611147 RepID=UPI0035A58D0C
MGQDATAMASEEGKVLRPGLLAGMSGLVTGAGSGIGRAVALRLMELGMDVAGVGRRIDILEETAQMAGTLPGRFSFESCDLRDADATEALVARIGDRQGIDLLVNNAGGQFYAPATEISRKGWDAVIAINLSSIFTLTKAAHPYLKARRGSVINISLSGIDRGSKGLAHSIAARAGVLGMARSMALEWAADGIRLNCIGPGLVTTEGLETPTARKMLTKLLAATPAGRATDPAEVAELTAFLASDAGRLMTGQLIQIDGAAHLGAGLHMID